MTEIFIALMCMTFVVAMIILAIYFLSLFENSKKGYMRAYQCKNCGAIYDPDEVPYICRNCGKEITVDGSIEDYHKTLEGLNRHRKETKNCRIVIARKIGRRWQVLPEEVKHDES